jgi:hypothetical protein
LKSEFSSDPLGCSLLGKSFTRIVVDRYAADQWV